MEGAIPSPPNTRIAVVTGGNKGIGFEVCRQLASGGVTVVLTARDETRGAEAVQKLRGLGLSDVVFRQLDVTDTSSVAGLADFLKTRFGKLDILVNNAAIGGVEYVEALDTDEEKRLEGMVKRFNETADDANKCLQTNYYGTKHVTEALLPLLQSSSDGRIVNVSSEYGQLKLISNEEVRQELNNVDHLTEQRLDELLDKFLKDFKAGEVAAHGWQIGISAYKMGKAALNAYSRILAMWHPKLRINCAHPGHVKTDLTMNWGFLTPEEGARNVVKVALLPDGGPTGVYFAEGEEASFE